MKTVRIKIQTHIPSLIDCMRKLFSPKDLKEEDREDFERELRELMYKTFKNGEYLDAEIVVDEKLNILSGRIIPYKEI